MDSLEWAEKLYRPSKSDDCCSDIHIPEPLLLDILSRLPSKSLMRFRCVCKSWYSIITHDPEFHKLHFLNFNSSYKDPVWIAYQLEDNFGTDTAKFWLCDESFASHNIQHCHINWEEEKPTDFFFSRIIDSCDGIVCLYLPVDEESLGIREVWGFEKFKFCLWNPSVRKYSMVRFPWTATEIYGFSNYFMMGFGVSASREYKVVVICRDALEVAHVYVYSLRTGSWTETGAKPDPWESKLNKDYGTYYNGSCHWIRLHKKQGVYSILCFNLNDHNLRYLDLPPKSECSPPFDCFRIFIYKDELCVWETIEEGKSFAVNIWAMKEYGNRDSWSNIHRVHIKEDSYFQYRYFRLFGIDTRERLLFRTSNEFSPLSSCDTQSGEIREFQSSETVDIWDMAPYQESLALL